MDKAITTPGIARSVTSSRVLNQFNESGSPGGDRGAKGKTISWFRLNREVKREGSRGQHGRVTIKGGKLENRKKNNGGKRDSKERKNYAETTPVCESLSRNHNGDGTPSKCDRLREGRGETMPF